MTWFDHHQYSKKLAAAAQSALRCGDEPGARRIYAQAAQEAEKALALVPRWKQVTRGVVAMSAARWWRRAHRSEVRLRAVRSHRDLLRTLEAPPRSLLLQVSTGSFPAGLVAAELKSPSLRHTHDITIEAPARQFARVGLVGKVQRRPMALGSGSTGGCRLKPKRSPMRGERDPSRCPCDDGWTRASGSGAHLCVPAVRRQMAN